MPQGVYSYIYNINIVFLTVPISVLGRKFHGLQNYHQQSPAYSFSKPLLSKQLLPLPSKRATGKSFENQGWDLRLCNVPTT